MKTIIAATAVIASLAGASAAFALEPTDGSAVHRQASYGYVENAVGHFIKADGARIVSKNLNAVYGFNSDHGVSVGSRSSAE